MRRCEKYVPSSRVLAARYATAIQAVVELAFCSCQCNKTLFIIFQKYIRISPFQINIPIISMYQEREQYFIYIKKKKCFL